MSQAPYVLKEARFGRKMGDCTLIDSLLCDGLVDAFNHYHMGITAENIAHKFGITREQQDKFAVNSENKCEKAINDGKFRDEIIPVSRDVVNVVDKDEFPRAGVTYESLSKLRTAFDKEGSVTAGNSSGINDGAAALVLMSKEKLKA